MSDQDQSHQQQVEVASTAVDELAIAVKTKKPRRRFLFGLGLLLLACALTVLWIVQTQAGSRFFLQSLGVMSGGRLSFHEVHGRLADTLQIDELIYRDTQQKISVSGLQMEWQAWSLMQARVDVSALTMSTLRISTKPSTTVVSLPSSLQLPIDLNIKQVAIGRLVLSELSADGQEIKPLELKAIVGDLQAKADQHQFAVQLDSAWGGLRLQSKIQTSRPFLTAGTFTYHGQVNQDLPKVLLQGSLSGSLQALLIQAKSVAKSSEGLQADPQQQLSADMQLHLAPFSNEPLGAIQLKIVKLNPQWINHQAPNAMLDVEVKLQPPVQPDVTKKVTPASTNLSGEIRVRNSTPQTIDKQGLPFKTLVATVNWQGAQLTLSKTKVELIGGSIVADSKLQFRQAKLPLLDAKLVLKDIDLAQIDSRLRQSSIQGTLQLQAKGQQRLDFQAQLKEPRASLHADASFVLNQAGNNGLLQVQDFELQAEQARLSGRGEINFEGNQAFKLQAKMTQFDPAHWWLAPHGKLDGELNLSGTMAGKASIIMHLPTLSGELSGQKIAASGRAEWLQASTLKLDQVEMQWGANKLSANGAIGNFENQLQVNLQANELGIFESLTGFSLTGMAKVNATISGKFDALAVALTAHAEDLRSARGFAIAQLDGDLQLGANPNDPLRLQLTAKELKSAGIALSPTSPTEKDQQSLPIEKRKTVVERLQLSVKGTRNNHQIEVDAQFEQTQQLLLVAQGAIGYAASPAPSRSTGLQESRAWSGRVEQLKVTGFGAKVASHMPIEDMVLLSPMNLYLSAAKVSVGGARLAGGFGKLVLDSVEWTPNTLSSKVKWDEFPVMEVVKFIRPQESLHGDLRLGLQWDVQLKDNIRGELNIARQSGDLTVQDADGTGQTMALGLSEASLQVQAGGLISGSDAERVRVQVSGFGKRLGQWRAKLETQISKIDDKWTLSANAPISGELQASTSELQWLAGQISSDFALKGALKLDASFGGKVAKPTYQANLEGHGLELAFAAEGLLFPNGELRAQLNQDILKLEQLKFSNKVTFIPKVERLQDLPWLGREGEFVAMGEVNWRNQTGAIKADWTNFPLLQRKDRWLVVSGQANITQVDRAWALIGKLRADAAYFKLPKMPPPSLSSDVLVTNGLNNGGNNSVKLIDEDVALDDSKKGLQTKLDLQIDMGKRFVFVGRGLDTALTGTLRLRSNDGSPVHASGSIITDGGQYEGYGQQLEIERGILNFQGAPSNPALNIRALRKGLAVEAGVDVTGTVANPQVRLVSEPNVPDSEKISWLVLGRESDQVGSADASLLLSAAGAIFGGDGSRNIPRELVQGLGFDEFSIGPAESGGSSKLPSQTVAGAISVGASSNDKVVNIGKRLRPGIVLSVERGVSDASGALKLSWQLSRRVRFIGRSGTDNSVDVKYSFSFN